MVSLRGKSTVWVAVLTAVLCLTLWYLIDVSSTGAHCKSVPCTYIDASGIARPGTCGVAEGDNRKCYCIVDDDKSLRQEQTGCAAKR